MLHFCFPNCNFSAVILYAGEFGSYAPPDLSKLIILIESSIPYRGQAHK